MSSEVLFPCADPMGRAIYEYHKFGKAEDVVVHSAMFDDDVIPIETLFRSLVEMPAIERVAWKLLMETSLMWVLEAVATVLL